jgi:phage terminase large subunit
MTNELHRNLTKWQQGLFKPFRYKIIHGGRGSGKSWAVADALISMSLYKKHLVLCGREFQNSIKDSVHSLLQQRIEAMGLGDYFEITRDEINCNYSGSRFIFKGLRHNVDSIKSMAGITHLWIEEADTLSAESWRVIEPTIREPMSEIWCTFNPKNKTDILYKTFIENELPKDSYVVKVNYEDNPHFPEVLKDQMERLKLKDHGMYRHVWLGECLEHSDAQIFKGYWLESEFEEPQGMHKYFGLDFGFSQDPTAGIRCFVDKNILYITHEAVKKGLEIDETAKFIEKRLPDLKRHTIYADNARPETISMIKRQGYSIKAVEKGKGTIEDGIEYIKSFDKIIINPRCPETVREFTLYSYKVDERSGDITNTIVDANNHCIDALRYALERSMKNKSIDYSKLMSPDKFASGLYK